MAQKPAPEQAPADTDGDAVEFAVRETPAFDAPPLASPFGGAEDDTPEAEEGESAGAFISEPLVDGVLRAAFDAVAARRGPHWSLSDDEAANIVPPLTRELQRVPFLRDVPVDSDLGLVLLHGTVIVGARLMEDAAAARRLARVAEDGRRSQEVARDGVEAVNGQPGQRIHRSEIYGDGA